MSQILTDCRFTVRCPAWRANSGSNTPRDIRSGHELGLDKIGYRVACTWLWRDSRGDNVGYLRLIGGVHESTRIDTNPCARDGHSIRGIRVHSWITCPIPAVANGSGGASPSSRDKRLGRSLAPHSKTARWRASLRASRRGMFYDPSRHEGGNRSEVSTNPRELTRIPALETGTPFVVFVCIRG